MAGNPFGHPRAAAGGNPRGHSRTAACRDSAGTSADECAAHLIALKFNARIRADTRTNSVFVISADVEQLSKIEAIERQYQR